MIRNEDIVGIANSMMWFSSKNRRGTQKLCLRGKDYDRSGGYWGTLSD